MYNLIVIVLLSYKYGITDEIWSRHKKHPPCFKQTKSNESKNKQEYLMGYILIRRSWIEYKIVLWSLTKDAAQK